MSTYAVRATLRPTAQTTDYRKRSTLRSVGILIALAGVMLAAVALIANIIVANDNPADRADTLAWTFGLGTTAFMVVKLGIAATLVGILVRLWLRVESVKVPLAELKPAAKATDGPYGDIKTTYGAATATKQAPKPLLIHRIAEWAWLPMVAMGPMLVIAGLVASFVQSGENNPGTFQDLGAWVQGGQYLGEAFILGGISFLLGTILSSLRRGGGEVQEALGVTVKTLKFPLSAWAFVGLMAMGVMTAMAQFALYIVATNSGNANEYFAWLGPVREFSLGLLLSGVVLALYTIGTVLGFQFDRLSQIVKSGR